MLKYREYRNKFTENAPEVEESPEEAGPDLAAQIDAVIDKWVQSLKMAFVSNEPQKRGLWDRFKNTVANVWHGRDDVSNPYKYVNKFGDNLGQPQESFNLLSLSHYQELRDICDSLEILLEDENPLAGTENLRLMRMIDQKAQELKASLRRIVGLQTPHVKDLEDEIEDDKPLIPAAGTPSPPAGAGTPTTPTPAAAPIPPVAPKVPWERLSDDEKYTTRPIQGRHALAKWDELTPEEKSKWDIYGGGLEHKTGRKPLKDLPWIIRLGDPRIEHIRLSTGNNRQINGLERDGRIEAHDNPIQSKQDLDDRIKKIKNQLIINKQDYENYKNKFIQKNTPEGGEIPANEIPPEGKSAEEGNSEKPFVQQDFKTGDLSSGSEDSGSHSHAHTLGNGLATAAHRDFKLGNLDDEDPNKLVVPNKDEDPNKLEDPNKDEVPPPHEEDGPDPLEDDEKLSSKKLMDYMIDPKNNIEDENLRNDLFIKISKLKKGSPIVGADLENAIKIRDAIWKAIEDQDIAAEKAQENV